MEGRVSMNQMPSGDTFFYIYIYVGIEKLSRDHSAVLCMIVSEIQRKFISLKGVRLGDLEELDW